MDGDNCSELLYFHLWMIRDAPRDVLTLSESFVNNRMVENDHIAKRLLTDLMGVACFWT